jgi:hypothetical protein
MSMSIETFLAIATLVGMILMFIGGLTLAVALCAISAELAFNRVCRWYHFTPVLLECAVRVRKKREDAEAARKTPGGSPVPRDANP